MNTTLTKPSFNTCYYIRKLLLSYEKEVKAVVTPKSGFCFNSEEVLKELLYSVYLEEVLEQHFCTLYKENSIISKKIEQLEKIVDRHQSLVNNSGAYDELAETKREIFWLLGFKTIIVKIEDVLNALNQLSKFSKDYLGNTITVNNWQNTRPGVDWLTHFQIERSATFVCTRQITEPLTFEQLKAIQDWVVSFAQRSNLIIRDFNSIVEQQKIGELFSEVLLTHVSYYSCWSNKF